MARMDWDRLRRQSRLSKLDYPAEYNHLPSFTPSNVEQAPKPGGVSSRDMPDLGRRSRPAPKGRRQQRPPGRSEPPRTRRTDSMVPLVAPASLGELFSANWLPVTAPSWMYLPQWLNKRLKPRMLLAVRRHGVVVVFAGEPQRVWVLDAAENRRRQESLGLRRAPSPLPGRWVAGRYNLHAGEHTDVPTARQVLQGVLEVKRPQALVWLQVAPQTRSAK